MYNRTFELVILGLWLCVAITVYVQKDLVRGGGVSIAKSLKVSEEELEVKRISILGNNLFELIVEDGSNKSKTIVGKIDCEKILCTDSELISLFRKVNNPTVVLAYRNNDGTWLFKMNFFLENEKTSLRKWLSSRNLVER